MTEAPAAGYQPRLRISGRQQETAYGTGSVFFYCRFGNYYCAGHIVLPFERGGVTQAAIELWHNAVPGDVRLRYAH